MAWPTVTSGQPLLASQFNALSSAIQTWQGNVSSAGFSLTNIGGMAFQGPSPISVTGAATFSGSITFSGGVAFTFPTYSNENASDFYTTTNASWQEWQMVTFKGASAAADSWALQYNTRASVGNSDAWVTAIGMQAQTGALTINSATTFAGNVTFTNAPTFSAVAQTRTNLGLATVASTGSYNDLLNKPTIPSAQVNSDWNAVSGVAQILNKPTIPAAQVAANLASSSSTGVTGILPLANGGTGQTTAQAAINALTGAQSAGKFLRSDGTNATLSTIQVSDVPTLNQNTSGNAATSTTATNLAGGVFGSVHYQSAANTTATLAPNTAASDMVLVSHGTGTAGSAPTWSNAPALSAANMTGFPATTASGLLSSNNSWTGTNTFNSTVTVAGGALNVAQGLAIQIGLNTDPFYTTFDANSLNFHRAGLSYIDQSTVGGSLVFRTSASAANDTTNLTLTSSGNALIGTTTDNGTDRLQVSGSAYFSNAAQTRTNLGLVASATIDTTNASNITSGTLANARLSTSVVTSVVSDTNVTGSITSQVLTLGWSGTLAKTRLLSTVVYTDQANVHAAGNKNTFTPSATTSGFNLAGVSADPSTPAAGDAWFRSDLSQLSYYNGTVVKRIATADQIPSVPVTSVFGRTGAVVATSGDYSFSLISGSATLAQLPTSVVAAVTNDTNITGSISAQNLTLAWSGQLSIARGGTGAGTQQAAINALTGVQSAGKFLRSDGTNATLSSIQVADVPTLNQSTSGNAATATTATNLAGGVLGSVHYQSAANTTAMLAPNTAASDMVLVSHGTGTVGAAPAWSNAPALSAANMTGFPASVGSGLLSANNTWTGSQTFQNPVLTINTSNNAGNDISIAGKTSVSWGYDIRTDTAVTGSPSGQSGLYFTTKNTGQGQGICFTDNNQMMLGAGGMNLNSTTISGNGTFTGNVTFTGAVSNPASARSYALTVGNAATVGWVKLGTLVFNRYGATAVIQIQAGQGYNSNSNQQSLTDIVIRNGSGTPAAPNLSGISAYTWGSSGTVLNVTAAATGASTSATNLSWDIWINLGAFTWGSYYVFFNDGIASWTDVQTTGANPGSASNTVVQSYVVNVMDYGGIITLGTPLLGTAAGPALNLNNTTIGGNGFFQNTITFGSQVRFNDGYGLFIDTNTPTFQANYYSWIQPTNGALNFYQWTGSAYANVVGMTSSGFSVTVPSSFTSALSISSSSAAPLLTVTEIGSGYASGNAAIRAYTQNANGASNYYYDGAVNGVVNYAVRADGRVWSNGGSFAVSSTITDLVNNSTWYGIGLSNFTTLPGSTGIGAVQLGGFYGIQLVSNLGNLAVTASGLVLVRRSTDDGSGATFQVAGGGSFQGAISVLASGTSTVLATCNSSGNLAVGGLSAPRQQLSVGSSLDLYVANTSTTSTSSVVSNIRAATNGGLGISAGSAGAIYLNVDAGQGGVVFCAGDGTANAKASVTSGGCISSFGYDVNGANFRINANNSTTTGIGTILRNDNANFYLLLTATNFPVGTWNTLRPLTVALSTGAVSLDATGAGVTCGGKIVSTWWNVQTVVSGGGPIANVSGGFTAHGGTILLFVSASCFTTTANTVCGVNVILDNLTTNTTIGTLKLWFNQANVHMSLPSQFMKLTVAAGNHTITMTGFGTGVSSDTNDNFYVTVVEFPF